MSDHTYVINFDASQTNLASFNQYLTDAREIQRFWNYIPLSYFVKTNLAANDLASKIASFVPIGNFIIAEVNLSNMQGRLPQAAWQWFYSATPPDIASMFGRPGLPTPIPPKR